MQIIGVSELKELKKKKTWVVFLVSVLTCKKLGSNYPYPYNKKNLQSVKITKISGNYNTGKTATLKSEGHVGEA